MMQKDLLRIDEVAGRLAVSENQVRNLLDVGALEGVLISSAVGTEKKHVRVKVASLERFLNDPKRRV